MKRVHTNGKPEVPNSELEELLRYMECTTEENACNETLRKIHEMVETVKEDQEASLEYMKIFEREQMLLEQGREEERKNTEKERKNAEMERERADIVEQENQKLRELLIQSGVKELLLKDVK